MTPCAEHRDTDFDREHDAHRYEIVYVIKRPGYEFALSVPPRTQPTSPMRRHVSIYASKGHIRTEKLSLT